MLRDRIGAASSMRDAKRVRHQFRVTREEFEEVLRAQANADE